MDFLPTTPPPLGGSIQINQSEAAKPSRFGFKKAPSIAEKTNQAVLEHPPSKIDITKQEIEFSVKPMSEKPQTHSSEARSSTVFNHTYPAEEFHAENVHLYSKMLLGPPDHPKTNGTKQNNGKSSDSIILNEYTNKSTIDPIIIKENKINSSANSVSNIKITQTNIINFTETIQKGTFCLGRLNSTEGSVKITDSKGTIDEDTVVITDDGLIAMTAEQMAKNPEFKNYRIMTDDPALEKHIASIQERIQNGTVFILTKDEFTQLNQINQNRLANINNQNQKKDNALATDKPEHKNAPSAKMTKEKENADPKRNESVDEKNTSTATTPSFIINAKNEKARMEERREERELKKEEELRLADKTNRKNIDERVSNRIKKQ